MSSIAVWQLKPEHFTVAGKYSFSLNGKTVELDVDDKGRFEVREPIEGPLYVDATLVKP